MAPDMAAVFDLVAEGWFSRALDAAEGAGGLLA
jgi:hypothetical protein